MPKKVFCDYDVELKIFSNCYCVGTVSSCEDYSNIFNAMSKLNDLGISVTLKEIQQEIFNAEKLHIPTLVAFAQASKLGLTC